MINIYGNLKDDEGNTIPGRTMLFLRETDVNERGEIKTFLSGLGVSPTASGTLLIVDDYIISQIDKVQFVDGELSVKNGETIEEPVKSEIELKREALLRQLAELDAQEPAAE